MLRLVTHAEHVCSQSAEEDRALYALARRGLVTIEEDTATQLLGVEPTATGLTILAIYQAAMVAG